VREQLLRKLEEVERRFREVEGLLVDPEVIRNPELYQRYAKEHAELKRLTEPFRRLKAIEEEIASIPFSYCCSKNLRYFLVNFSILPAVSTSFCLPVKKG